MNDFDKSRLLCYKRNDSVHYYVSCEILQSEHDMKRRLYIHNTHLIGLFSASLNVINFFLQALRFPIIKSEICSSKAQFLFPFSRYKHDDFNYPFRSLPDN